MPYYERQEALNKSLEAYRRIYPEGLEIVICDDGSKEPVIAPGCVVVSLPKKDRPLNPCVPINRAVEATTGDVIVLTNPEIVHTERTFDRMREMIDNDLDYVVASCRDDSGMWLAGETVRYDQNGRLSVPPGGHFHFCAMFSRWLWDGAGGFDEDYRYGQACDDNDWLWRLHRIGAHFKLCPSVVTHTRSNLKWNLPHNRGLFLNKWPHLA